MKLNVKRSVMVKGEVGVFRNGPRRGISKGREKKNEGIVDDIGRIVAGTEVEQGDIDNSVLLEVEDNKKIMIQKQSESHCLELGDDKEQCQYLVRTYAVSSRQSVDSRLGNFYENNNMSFAASAAIHNKCAEIQTVITEIIWAHRNRLDIDPDKYEVTPVTIVIGTIDYWHIPILVWIFKQTMCTSPTMKKLQDGAGKSGHCSSVLN